MIPADFERVKKQIENVEPYVDKILGYQFLGLMNPPGSLSFAGHDNSAKFYEDYKKYTEEKK